MFLNTYQSEARATAVYPPTMFYPTLGLSGEFGEFVEKLYKANPNHIQAELGDMLWYAANLAAEMEATLTDALGLVGCPSTKFEDLEVWAMDNRGSLKIESSKDALAIQVGAISESVKKMYRDDDGVLSEARRSKILTHLAWVLIGISTMTSSLDLRFEPVAILNLKKLARRQKQGTIHGDGDNR